MLRYIALAATLSLLSCKKSTDDNPTPAATATNSLTGYAKGYDFEQPDSLVKSGIQVSALGNNGAVVAQTTTDARGFFKMESVAVGTYDLAITKPGYGTMTYYSVYNGAGPRPTFFTLTDSYSTICRNISSTVSSASVVTNQDGGTYWGKLKIQVNAATNENPDNLHATIYKRKSGTSDPFRVAFYLVTSKTKTAANSYDLKISNGYLGSSSSTWDLQIVLSGVNNDNYFLDFEDRSFSALAGTPSQTLTYTTP